MKQVRAKQFSEIVFNCNIQRVYSEHLRSLKILQCMHCKRQPPISQLTKKAAVNFKILCKPSHKYSK